MIYLLIYVLILIPSALLIFSWMKVASDCDDKTEKLCEKWSEQDKNMG